MPDAKRSNVIELRREPCVECGSCGGVLWYMITLPDKDKIPKELIAFECGGCGVRLATHIKME